MWACTVWDGKPKLASLLLVDSRVEAAFARDHAAARAHGKQAKTSATNVEVATLEQESEKVTSLALAIEHETGEP